ncbi:hypothetical protein EMPS_04825 [Entomortierella parvispora]|uniref:EH domain-containing protein n=1 Tax=Entomortierella parvispora TaxID=205924 RepID=A0A9P3H9X3_9FUNG|nr:hypothetical protein EMPS_04825 [Entomortierella parvispora]
MPSNLSSSNARRPPLTLTAQEKPYYDELWAEADSTQEGFLSRDAAMVFFRRSGLNNATLDTVWELADVEKHGVLGKNGFNVALRVIGHNQARPSPTSFTPILTPGPLPRFENTKATDKTIHARVNDNWSNQDLLHCQVAFQNLGPKDGRVRAVLAKESFISTGLSHDTLVHIWRLADRSKIDKMNLFDFTVAHYYIKLVLYGATELPESVPEEVLEACKHPPGVSATELPEPSSSSSTLPAHNTTDLIGAYNTTFGNAQADEQRQQDELLKKAFKEAEKQQAKDAELLTNIIEKSGKEQAKEAERLRNIYQEAQTQQEEEILKYSQDTQSSENELCAKIEAFKKNQAQVEDQYMMQFKAIKNQAQMAMHNNLMLSTQLSGGIGGNFAAGALMMQRNSVQQMAFQEQMASIIQACANQQQKAYAQLLSDVASYPESQSDHYQKIFQEIRDNMHKLLFGSGDSTTAPASAAAAPDVVKLEPKPEPDVMKPESNVVRPEPLPQPLTPATTIVAPEPLTSVPVPPNSNPEVQITYPGVPSYQQQQVMQPTHQQFSTNPADYVQRPVQYSVNPAEYILPQNQQQTYSTNPEDYFRPQQQQQQAYMANLASYSRPQVQPSFTADPFDLLKKYLKPQLYTTDPNRYNTQYLTDPNQHLVRTQPHHHSVDPNQYVVRPQPLPSQQAPQPVYHPQSPPLSHPYPGQQQSHQPFHYSPTAYTAQTMYAPQQQVQQPPTASVYSPQPQPQMAFPPQKPQTQPQVQPVYPPQKQPSQPQPQPQSQQLSQPVYPSQQQQQHQQQQFYPAQPTPCASPPSSSTTSAYVPPSPLTSFAGLPPPPQYELIDNNKIWRPQVVDPGQPLQYQAPPPATDAKAPMTPTSPANDQQFSPQQQFPPRLLTRPGNPQDRYSQACTSSSSVTPSASVAGLENSFSALGITKDNSQAYTPLTTSIPPPLPSRAPQYREPVHVAPERVRAPQLYQPQYYPDP